MAVVCAIISRRKFVYELRWVYGASLYFTILLFGFWLAGRSIPNHFQEHLRPGSQKTALLVKLNSKPIIKNKIRFSASVLNVGEEPRQPVNGRLILYFDPSPEADQLEYGDLVQLITRVTPISPPSNPDAYNFQQVMAYNYTTHQAFPKEKVKEWVALGINVGNPIYQYAYSFQERLLSIIDSKLKGDNEKIVASALLLGDRSRITTELKAAYSETGAMHILAVSGLHVGLLFFVISMLLNLFKVKHWYWRYLKAAILLFSVWSFALITGLAPSVVRAAAMISFIVVGIMIHRNGNIYNTIAGSAFVLLVIHPNFLYQVGFQLSYLALLGIIYFQPKFYRQLQFTNPIMDKVWALITVSLSAQVLTFPISLYYFHQFPIYFWLSGIVVVPAATIIVPLGIGLFLFGNIPILGSLVAFLLEAVLFVMNAIVQGIQHLPFATVKDVWLTLPMVVLLYVAIFSLLMFLRKSSKSFVYTGCIALACFLMMWIVEMVQQSNQSFVTAYSFSDRSVVDFVYGNTVYSFTNSFKEDDTYRFAVSNHRRKHGVDHVVRFGLDKEGEFPGLSVKNGLVTFNGKRFLLVDDSASIDSGQGADFLLLCGVQTQQIDTILLSGYQEVVIDRACHWNVVNSWETQCKTNNQPYHNIRRSGYWSH